MYITDIGFQLLALFFVFWIFLLVAGFIMAYPGKKKLRFKKKHDDFDHNMTRSKT